MNFRYRTSVSPSPDGDFLVFVRPEIPFDVVGPAGSGTYVGLVDTGSDQTILPKSIADDLGILLEPMPGPPASVFGGHHVALLAGEATLQITGENETIRWSTPLCFCDFPSTEEETIVLGYAGFLEFFTATFDGKLAILKLEPNDDLPRHSPK